LNVNAGRDVAGAADEVSFAVPRSVVGELAAMFASPLHPAKAAAEENARKSPRRNFDMRRDLTV
jgi:hypothetical protein